MRGEAAQSALKLGAVNGVLLAGGVITHIDLLQGSVRRGGAFPDRQLPDDREQTAVVDASGRALAAPFDGNTRGLALVLLEVHQLEAVLKDVARSKHAGDLFRSSEIHQRLQAEPAVADDQIQQEVSGYFHAPLPDVDYLRDGAVKKVPAVGCPGCSCRKPWIVNLLRAHNRANAKPIACQQVSQNTRKIVEAAQAAVHVGRELRKVCELPAGADIHPNQR